MNVTIVSIVAAAAVAVVLLIVFGKKMNVFSFKIFGHSGVEARRTGESGAHADHSHAEKGSIKVENNAGGSATANQSRAGQDITVQNKGREDDRS